MDHVIYKMSEPVYLKREKLRLLLSVPPLELTQLLSQLELFSHDGNVDIAREAVAGMGKFVRHFPSERSSTIDKLSEWLEDRPDHICEGALLAMMDITRDTDDGISKELVRSYVTSPAAHSISLCLKFGNISENQETILQLVGHSFTSSANIVRGFQQQSWFPSSMISEKHSWKRKRRFKLQYCIS